MSVTSQRDAGRTCTECLNTAACWVCEGRGSITHRTGSAPCAACTGRGMCRACRPVPEQRSGDREHLSA